MKITDNLRPVYPSLRAAAKVSAALHFVIPSEAEGSAVLFPLEELYLMCALHVANARQAPQATHDPGEVPHVFGFQNKFDDRL